MIELEAVGKLSSGNRIVTDAPYILIGRSRILNSCIRCLVPQLFVDHNIDRPVIRKGLLPRKDPYQQS